MNDFAHWTPPANDVSGQERVDFTIRRHNLSVSASVPASYFDEHVLPIVTSLLQEIGANATVPAPQQSPARQPVEPDEHPLASVKTIAQKLTARTAPQILKAAAISLRVLHDKEQFTRDELLHEAQLAHGFWKKSHAESADKVLDYLVGSGALIETFDGQYALSSAEEIAAIAALT